MLDILITTGNITLTRNNEKQFKQKGFHLSNQRTHLNIISWGFFIIIVPENKCESFTNTIRAYKSIIDHIQQLSSLNINFNNNFQNYFPDFNAFVLI